VELTGDCGGKAPAAVRPVRGRTRVARALVNGFRIAARGTLRPVEVNGGPGVLFLDAEERLLGVVALEIAGGRIAGIRAIVNPDKLTHLGPVGDFKSLLRPAR
jgi:hypothetical protein